MEMNDLNINDQVIYKGQEAIIVDHYGAGICAIELNGEWIAVKRNELTVK